MIFSKKENNLVQVPNRSLFLRLEENKEIQCILEEGFIFLTERLNDQTLVDIFRRFRMFLLNFSFSQTYRSDFWRNQKPMYVEEGERVTRRMSMMEDTQTRMKRGPDKSALFTIRLNIWSSLFALWSLILITQVFSHNDYLPVLKLESRVSINNFWAR